MKHDKQQIRHCAILPIATFFLLAAYIPESQATKDANSENTSAKTSSQITFAKQVPANRPLYRIKLRVHLAQSGRVPQEFRPIFNEINTIWKSQADICFEIHTVDHNNPIPDGLDMWFSPYIGGFNGYYDGEYIQMTDTPILNKAPNPARFSTARTAAHELGHALQLPHRQNSNDNLMRSKTYGWQLNENEIAIARKAASEIARNNTKPIGCGPAKINETMGVSHK